jgi:hypothetical protein
VVSDPVNHPPHYTQGEAKCAACGHSIECIDVAEHHGFTIGNAIKYLWRYRHKGSPLQDLRKAVWYIEREIQRREREDAERHTNG